MDWPLNDGSQYRTIGTIDSSRGGTIYSPTTIHVKGSWNQIAVAPFDTSEVRLGYYSGGPTPDINMLMDVGRGTPGAINIFLQNAGYQVGATPGPCVHFPIPLEMQSGEILSFRTQASTATPQVMHATVTFAQKGYSHSPSGQVYTYGASTATSTGTLVTCGTNVKGAWAQLTASASSTTHNIFLVVSGEPAPGFNNGEYLYDIGVGAAGSERVKLPDLRFRALSAQSYLHPPAIGPIPCVIRAGERIAMRGQTNDPGRDAYFILYAF